MAFYEREKKILAGSGNNNTSASGTAYRFSRRKRFCALYLHNFLRIMKQDNKTTILIISMGFLALHFIFGWGWALIVSFAVGIAGIFSPFLTSGIVWAWEKLTIILQYIIPNILLGLVFFFVLTPISLISRLFTKDPLMLSGDHESYFIGVDKSFSKDSFEKIW